jgi:cytochrome c5
MSFKHFKNAFALSLICFVAPSQAGIENGRAVYLAVCKACHAPENVMVSAPKAGDAEEWRKRLHKGIDAAADNAIKGIGAMPPKGGHTELTREDILRAIEFMKAAKN